ncbi:hypothetical protein WH95_19815 [Kiloniella litopenaei]|uniref:Uncharacterized protein n=1 Tax=Kiloniella litopenaei TaxID=1549748 RepID=A0A0M2R430_9PROT|nr:hypothetical protein [Kiloniella litopenaei]KKJ75169.1 hypothetical protein WH95_19815 [Kiloniella litopenaei]
MKNIIGIAVLIFMVFIAWSYVSYRMFPSVEECQSELAKYSYGNPSVSRKRAEQCLQVLEAYVDNAN